MIRSVKKTELVELVVQRIIAEIEFEMSEIIKQDYNAITEMIFLRDVVVKRLKNQKSSPQFQLKKYYPNVYSKYRDKQIHIIGKSIKANMLKGIEQAYYHDDLSIDFTVNLYIVGILGIKDEALLNTQNFTPKQLYHEFVLYHLRSMTTQKGQEKMNEILKA